MNETAIVYIVHSDLDENNIFAMFEDEIEAIMYARRHKEDLTYVDKTEMSLDESGDYDEVLSAETIWVYDEDEDPEDIEDAPELSDEELFNIDFDELEREVDDEESWFEDLDTDSLVETLEENEDIVECKECFELFPKEACTKIAIGYICPDCGKIHSHEEPEFEIDSIPEVVIADDDFFKVDFPEVERHDYKNEMIPDEPTPEVENVPILEPECVGPECEAPVEAPVTKDETITKLVVDEHEAIDGYEKAKIEIEANSELDEKEKEEILDTIEHIKEEEVEHIEELEELIDEVEEAEKEEDSQEPLMEYFFDDNDPKNWSDKEPIIYEVFYKEKLVGYLQFNYRGEEVEPEQAEITKALINLHDDLIDGEVLPEDSSIEDLTYAYGYTDLDDTLPIIEESLNEAFQDKVLVEGSGFLGKVVLDDYFKKDGQRNPENKNGTGYWVDLIDPDTKESIIKPEDKKTVQKLKEAETIATHLSRAEDGWAIIRVEGAQGWNGILEVYEKGKRTQDITQKKLANLNKAWDEQEATKKARKALDKSLGKDKPKDADNIDLPGNNEQQPNEHQNNTNVNNNGQDNRVEAKVIPTQGQLRSAYRLLVALLGTRAKATEYITVEGKGINAKYNLVQGKTFDDASLKIKELQKAALGESLTEHINEEHPAIESDQELEGIDNAVVDCKVKDGKCTSCNELVEAHRTGDFVKLVNDKFRTDQPVSVYDLKCLMKSCAVTVKQQGLSKINLIIDFDNNCEIIQETEKAYLVSVPCYFRNPKDRSQILDTPNYIAV